MSKLPVSLISPEHGIKGYNTLEKICLSEETLKVLSEFWFVLAHEIGHSKYFPIDIPTIHIFLKLLEKKGVSLPIGKELINFYGDAIVDRNNYFTRNIRNDYKTGGYFQGLQTFSNNFIRGSSIEYLRYLLWMKKMKPTEIEKTNPEIKEYIPIASAAKPSFDEIFIWLYSPFAKFDLGIFFLEILRIAFISSFVEYDYINHVLKIPVVKAFSEHHNPKLGDDIAFIMKKLENPYPSPEEIIKCIEMFQKYKFFGPPPSIDRNMTSIITCPHCFHDFLDTELSINEHHGVEDINKIPGENKISFGYKCPNCKKKIIVERKISKHILKCQLCGSEGVVNSFEIHNHANFFSFVVYCEKCSLEPLETLLSKRFGIQCTYCLGLSENYTDYPIPSLEGTHVPMKRIDEKKFRQKHNITEKDIPSVLMPILVQCTNCENDMGELKKPLPEIKVHKYDSRQKNFREWFTGFEIKKG